MVEIEPLTERIVKRVVDGGWRNAEASCGITVDVEEDLQALVLQVARHVCDLRQSPEPIDEARHPLGQELASPGTRG